VDAQTRPSYDKNSNSTNPTIKPGTVYRQTEIKDHISAQQTVVNRLNTE